MQSSVGGQDTLRETNEVSSSGCIKAYMKTNLHARKMKPTSAAEEKLIPVAGGTYASPARATEGLNRRMLEFGHLRRMSQHTTGITAPGIAL